MLEKLLCVSENVGTYMFTYLDGDDTIEALFLKFVINDIARNDGQIFESLLLGLGINVDFLSSRIRERRNLGVRKHFSKIQSSRSPPTAGFQSKL